MRTSKKIKRGLAIGFTMLSLSTSAFTSMAATKVSYGTTGWVQSGSAWKYIEANGTSVVDGWKEINGDRYYFNSSGDMMTNTIVKDNGEYYFVNEDGIMVKNKWEKLNVNNGTGWYYFGPTGQAYRNKSTRLTLTDFENINGVKYAFDSQGKMLTGWVKASDPDAKSQWYESDYYFSEKGIAAEGWHKLKVKPYNKSSGSTSNELEYWFYFDKGRKVTDSSRYINDRLYAFDTTDGHMLVDWLAVNNNGTAVIYNPENTEAVKEAADDSKKSDNGMPYVPEHRTTITEKTVVPDNELVKKKITIK